MELVLRQLLEFWDFRHVPTHLTFFLSCDELVDELGEALEVYLFVF